MLRDLLAVFGDGLRQPLPLAANISEEYMQKQRPGPRRKVKDAQAALEEIRNRWLGSSPPFESLDAYLRLAFADGVPFDDQFAPLAKRLFEPLLDNLIDG